MTLLSPQLAGAEVVIRDPAASPSQLGELFGKLRPLGLGPGASDALYEESRRLIALLATNANTPAFVLASIAGMSYLAARSVARNPGLSLALMVDPLCKEKDTRSMVREIAQRWPSDNELASALRPLLEEGLDDIRADAKIQAHAPGPSAPSPSSSSQSTPPPPRASTADGPASSS
jgi:hypothetical protein